MTGSHPIAHPVGARTLWLLLGGVSIPLAVFGLWRAVFELAFPASLVAAGLMALYGWLGTAALRLGTARGAVDVGTGVRVHHSCLLAEPLELDVGEVNHIAVDTRPIADRKVASSVRSSRASFRDTDYPCVSIAPRHHGSHSSATNAVVSIHGSRDAARVPIAFRMLLAIVGGRSGRYRGPRTGKPMPALRIEVADPDALARDVDALGLRADLERNRTYLEPIRPADRRKHRRQMLVVVGIVAGVLAIIVVASLAQA